MILNYGDRITVHDAQKIMQSGQAVKMVLPLWIGLKENAEWMFPIEPLISVSGLNEVKKRNVQCGIGKGKGTIKERITEGDYQINITGSFIHPDIYTYPSMDVSNLMMYIREKQALYVKNELLYLLGIDKIVIDSYSFPFSKGENVQNYSIEAISDDDSIYNLKIV